MKSRSTLRTISILSGGNFVQLGSRVLIGVLVPFLLVSFQTNRTFIGLALTGMWGIYGLSQFPSGLLADKYGEKNIVVLSLIITCVGTFLVGLSSNASSFTLSVLILGAGAGHFFSPATSLVSRQTQPARSLSLITGSGALAGVVFSLGGGIISVIFGWRIAIFASASVIFVMAFLAYGFLPQMEPRDPRVPLKKVLSIRQHIRLFSRPSVLFTVIMAGLLGFQLQSVFSFLTTYLVQYKGLNPNDASVLYGIALTVSAISQPIAGRVTSKYSRDRIIMASIAFEMLGLWCILIFQGVWTITGIILIGLGLAWPGLIQSRFLKTVGGSEKGYGFGLLRTAYMMIGSTGSATVGFLSDSWGWFVGFGMLLIVLIAALSLLTINDILDLGL